MPLIDLEDIDNHEIFVIPLAYASSDGGFHPLLLDDEGRVKVA